MFDGMR